MKGLATCLREHHPIDKQLKHADSVECAVEIECQECGKSGTVYYHDEILE